jgi:hypothetical protein
VSASLKWPRRQWRGWLPIEVKRIGPDDDYLNCECSGRPRCWSSRCRTGANTVTVSGTPLKSTAEAPGYCFRFSGIGRSTVFETSLSKVREASAQVVVHDPLADAVVDDWHVLTEAAAFYLSRQLSFSLVQAVEKRADRHGRVE